VAFESPALFPSRSRPHPFPHPHPSTHSEDTNSTANATAPAPAPAPQDPANNTTVFPDGATITIPVEPLAGPPAASARTAAAVSVQTTDGSGRPGDEPEDDPRTLPPSPPPAPTPPPLTMILRMLSATSVVTRNSRIFPRRRIDVTFAVMKPNGAGLPNVPVRIQYRWRTSSGIMSQNNRVQTKTIISGGDAKLVISSPETMTRNGQVTLTILSATAPGPTMATLSTNSYRMAW
jgi:hypothetical protein